MKIAIASDHGGYQLKEEIKKYLEGRNIEVVDLGTNSEESVDYPIYGKACGEAVMSGQSRSRYRLLWHGDRYFYRGQQGERHPLRALHGCSHGRNVSQT